MNIPDTDPITNLQNDSSQLTLHDQEILHLLAGGELESANGKGSTSSEVLAEAAALLARKGL